MLVIKNKIKCLTQDCNTIFTPIKKKVYCNKCLSENPKPIKEPKVILTSEQKKDKSAYQKEWYQKNKERYKKYNSNMKLRYIKHMAKKYGIDVETYIELYYKPRVETSEEEKKQKNRERDRKYYHASKERRKEQIKEAQKRYKEKKKLNKTSKIQDIGQDVNL